MLAFALQNHRDLGSGYLPEHEGKTHAGKLLQTVPGLLFKLNKTTIINWLIGDFLLGAAYGSIYGNMQEFLDSNELMKAMFIKTGDSIEASFTATIMTVLAALAVIVAIVVINKLFQLENAVF